MTANHPGRRRRADVAELFRQQFRKELRAARFVMQFAQSAPAALQRASAAEAAGLMITAYGAWRKAIEAGAAGLVTKLIDFPELRSEIGRRLNAATDLQ